MKVFSAPTNKFSTKRKQRRTRSLENLDSLYEQISEPTQKSTSAKLTCSARRRLGWNAPNYHTEKKTVSRPSTVVLNELAASQAEGRTKRVTFGNTDPNSWYQSPMCTRHLRGRDSRKDKTMALIERSYCEILGNQFCKVCNKTHLRRECQKDFEFTFLASKPHHHRESRSATPLSDIILCKYPPLPQSDSKGLFVRLHDFSSCPLHYYINPMEGIKQDHSETPLSGLYDETVLIVPNTLEKYSSGQMRAKNGSHEKEPNRELEDDYSIETQEDKPDPESTSAPKHDKRSFKTLAQTVAFASVPVRKSNTFLPELHLKEIQQRLKDKLLVDRETEDEYVQTNSRKEEFKEIPIEPPQITLNSALGIFDPKKRHAESKTINNLLS